MKSILNSFSFSRNAESVARSSPAASISSSPVTGSPVTRTTKRPLDEKVFNACVDVLETFSKKAAGDPKFIGALANSSSIHSFPSALSINNDVDTVVSAVFSTGPGIASKRTPFDGFSPVVLWLALIKVLDTCPPMFTAGQCDELRDANDGKKNAT